MVRLLLNAPSPTVRAENPHGWFLTLRLYTLQHLLKQVLKPIISALHLPILLQAAPSVALRSQITFRTFREK